MLQITTDLGFLVAVKDRLDHLGESECFDVNFNHSNGMFHPATPQTASSKGSHQDESINLDSQSYQIVISVESLGKITEGSERSIVVKFKKHAKAEPSSSELLPVIGKPTGDRPQSQKVDAPSDKLADKHVDCFNELLGQEDKISETKPHCDDADGRPSCNTDDKQNVKSPKRKRPRVDNVEFVIHSDEFEEVPEFSQKNELAFLSFGDDDHNIN